jgi:hypothetical protein
VLGFVTSIGPSGRPPREPWLQPGLAPSRGQVTSSPRERASPGAPSRRPAPSPAWPSPARNRPPARALPPRRAPLSHAAHPVEGSRARESARGPAGGTGPARVGHPGRRRRGRRGPPGLPPRGCRPPAPARARAGARGRGSGGWAPRAVIPPPGARSPGGAREAPRRAAAGEGSCFGPGGGGGAARALPLPAAPLGGEVHDGRPARGRGLGPEEPHHHVPGELGALDVTRGEEPRHVPGEVRGEGGPGVRRRRQRRRAARRGVGFAYVVGVVGEGEKEPGEAGMDPTVAPTADPSASTSPPRSSRSPCFPAVRRAGLEPAQELPHWNLNPARLPIPPPSRSAVFSLLLRLLVPSACASFGGRRADET